MQVVQAEPATATDARSSGRASDRTLDSPAGLGPDRTLELPPGRPPSRSDRTSVRP